MTIKERWTQFKTWTKDKWAKFKKWFMVVFGIAAASAATVGVINQGAQPQPQPHKLDYALVNESKLPVVNQNKGNASVVFNTTDAKIISDWLDANKDKNRTCVTTEEMPTHLKYMVAMLCPGAEITPRGWTDEEREGRLRFMTQSRGIANFTVEKK